MVVLVWVGALGVGASFGVDYDGFGGFQLLAVAPVGLEQDAICYAPN